MSPLLRVQASTTRYGWRQLTWWKIPRCIKCGEVLGSQCTELREAAEGGKARTARRIRSRVSRCRDMRVRPVANYRGQKIALCHGTPRGRDTDADTVGTASGLSPTHEGPSKAPLGPSLHCYFAAATRSASMRAISVHPCVWFLT